MPRAVMDYGILLRALAAGVIFGGVVAYAYRWFRRDRPEAAAHAWKIFVILAAIVAARFYFLYAP